METQDKAALPTTVDEYLALHPLPVQDALQNLRRIVREEAPEAEERISYQLPGYKYKGAPLVFFGAWPKHCALYGVSKALLATFKDELKPFRLNATTIHFTPENPLPDALVRRIVQERMRQNEALAAEKAARKEVAKALKSR